MKIKVREVAALPKNSLALAKRAWLKHGKKTETDVFPPYRRRFKNLLNFCGTYSMGMGLPDWWKELTQELRDKGWEWLCITELFENTTPEEFKLGQFQAKRHKECRQKLGEKGKRVISSPKISKFLREQFGVRHRFTVAFHDRGAKLQEKEIVITADPWNIVNMSTRGKSWSSCMNFIEESVCEVWANLCDPAILIALVRTKGDNSKKNVDTRVIIRYASCSHHRGKAPMRGVMIDRFYGDAAYTSAIQKLILKLCKKYNLCLFEYEYYDYSYQMKTGSGSNIFTVRGPWIKFPSDQLPYRGYHDWIEAKKRKGSYHLEAKVRLVFAPPTSNAAE